MPALLFVFIIHKNTPVVKSFLQIPYRKYAFCTEKSRRIDDLPPVEVAPLKRVDKSLARGDICSNGNIVNVAKPQQIKLVRLMGLGVKRISEIEKQVYLVAGDTRAYLLVSALGAAQIPLNVKSRSLGYHFARSARSAKVVPRQYAAVSDTELHQKLFFGIVRDQCNIHNFSILPVYACIRNALLKQYL